MNYFAILARAETALEPGFNVKHYDNEFFSDLKKDYTAQSIDLSFDNKYDSFNITGSFCPRTSGSYKFKLEGIRYVYMKISGNQIGDRLELPGNLHCESSSRESDSIYMNANQCYSIFAQLRTGGKGCDKYFRLYYSYENSEYAILDHDVYTEVRNNCYPGFYSEDCSQKCNVDCYGNGVCSDGYEGTGKCICDDGYDPSTNCSTNTLIVPPDCQLGANMWIYDDEISFDNLKKETTTSTLTLSPFKYYYDAMITRGSFLVASEGDYQFKIDAKSYAKFTFQGEVTGDIGAAGSCLDSTKVKAESNVYHLVPGMTYPFEIHWRGGCGLYSHHMILQWKNGPKYYGINNAQWEDIPTNYIYRCKDFYDSECVPGKYGEYCNLTCPEMNENQRCYYGKEGNGTLYCKEGYYGEDCYDTCIEGHDELCQENAKCIHHEDTNRTSCECDTNYYGDHCETQCDPTKCHNHGHCGSYGQCVCDTGYYGSYCERTSIDEPEVCKGGVKSRLYANEDAFTTVLEEETKSEINMEGLHYHYKSMNITGSILVDEETKATFRIRAKPIARFTINGISTPQNLISAGKCDDSFVTEEITEQEVTLAPNKYYPFTLEFRSGCDNYDQYIKLEWKRSGDKDFSIVPSTVLKQCQNTKCLSGFSGQDCSIQCGKECGAHGECQNLPDSSSRCECAEDYYGEFCGTFCRSDSTCNGMGICSENGTCECAAGYGGPHCDEFLDAAAASDGSAAVSCMSAANVKWHTNENFGSEQSSGSLNKVSLFIKDSTDYKSITISGSLVAPRTKYYRFKAVGKPEVNLEIQGVHVENGEFEGGTCNESLRGESLSNGAIFYASKLVPFQLKYKSGCGMYEKELEMYYEEGDSVEELEGQNWTIVGSEFLRNCNWDECEAGHYGANCNGICEWNKCGAHGTCRDGLNGDGSCKCEDWYIGSSCSVSIFGLIVGAFAAVLMLGMLWACWPVEAKAKEDNEFLNDEDSESQEGEMSSSNNVGDNLIAEGDEEI